MGRRPLNLFFSYSSRDEQLREELEIHLSVLRREGLISPWSYRRIVPGERWEDAIDEKLNAADIILLLISAYFMNSDYCWSVELTSALQRHERGEARVIPVVLRDCDWKTQDFASLQALPTSGKPITRFRPRDAGWTDVVLGIRNTVSAFGSSSQPAESRLAHFDLIDAARRRRTSLRRLPARFLVRRVRINLLEAAALGVSDHVHSQPMAEITVSTSDPALAERILSTVRTFWDGGHPPSFATVMSAVARNAPSRDAVAMEIRRLVSSGKLSVTRQEVRTYSPILTVTDAAS